MDQKEIEDLLWNCYCQLLVNIHLCSSRSILIKQEDLGLSTKIQWWTWN